MSSTDTTNLSLDYALEAFILNQRLRGNTTKTVKGYAWFVGRFIDWLSAYGVAQITDITLPIVQEYQLYIDSKPSDTGKGTLSKRTVQTYMRHVRVFLTYCYDEDLIPEPLHTKLKLPKANRPAIEIITEDEVDIILASFSKSEMGLRNTALVTLLLDSGLRLSEATGLLTENINFQRGYIKILGKGRKERIVPIGLKVRHNMIKYVHKRRQADFPQDNAYFFLSKERKPLTQACISHLMRRLKKSTGIPRLHAHLFRHTFATNFLIHGLGDVYELSRILGHSDIKVTEGYLQLASFYTIIEKRKKLSYLDTIKRR